MRAIRKLMLVVFAVLTVGGVAEASSAWAVTATAPPGLPIAAGTEIVGTGTTNSTFTAVTLFGDVDFTCDQSKVVGVVEANPSASGKVWASISSLTWSGCSHGGGACTAPPTAVGLPWSPTTNGGGLVATSTTTGDMGTGTGGGIDWSECMGISPCTIAWGNTSTITDGALTLTNWLSGSYSSDELTIASTAIRAVNCAGISNMSWNAKYTLELTNGTPVTLS